MCGALSLPNYDLKTIATIVLEQNFSNLTFFDAPSAKPYFEHFTMYATLFDLILMAISLRGETEAQRVCHLPEIT